MPHWQHVILDLPSVLRISIFTAKKNPAPNCNPFVTLSHPKAMDAPACHGRLVRSLTKEKRPKTVLSKDYHQKVDAFLVASAKAKGHAQSALRCLVSAVPQTKCGWRPLTVSTIDEHNSRTKRKKLHQHGPKRRQHFCRRRHSENSNVGGNEYKYLF